ncbi:hypothetical protein FRAHR75_430061 [Frankia sp. Hr75.2]|nr:hypothetical protein FRAHR75_430061 [Frankia sp. Hr75.2]
MALVNALDGGRRHPASRPPPVAAVDRGVRLPKGVGFPAPDTSGAGCRTLAAGAAADCGWATWWPSPPGSAHRSPGAGGGMSGR